MDIRLFNKSDLDEVAKLSLECLGESMWTKDMFEKSLANIKIFIAEQNNNILGFLNILDNGFEYEILNIAVDNKYQKQGIGTKLLNYFLENSKIQDIFLEVSSQNTNAINFYIKNGFEKISTRKNYYKNSDAIIMKKQA